MIEIIFYFFKAVNW